MKTIPLHGQKGAIVAFALVDDADFESLSKWHWRINRGYAQRSIRPGGRAGKIQAILMHRAILGLSKGDGLFGDHINRNTLDNRRENLRIVTATQNSQNRRGHKGTSRYRGVHFNSRDQKWYAKVFLDGRLHYLGSFEGEDEAGVVARAFRAEHMAFSTEH